MPIIRYLKKMETFIIIVVVVFVIDVVVTVVIVVIIIMIIIPLDFAVLFCAVSAADCLR